MNTPTWRSALLALLTLLPTAVTAAESADTPAHPAAALAFRAIGPAYPSGRIADFAIHPQSRAHWYVATASGGLWETRNAGTTWSPLFDEQASYAIGAIAMDPQEIGRAHV